MYVCVFVRRALLYAKTASEVLQHHDVLVNLQRQLSVDKKRLKSIRRELRAERAKLPALKKRHENCSHETEVLSAEHERLLKQLSQVKISQEVLTVHEWNRKLESQTIADAIECGEISTEEVFRFVRRGDTRMLSGLLRSDTVDVDRFKDRFGNTLLIVAVQCLESKMVKILLEFGADPNLSNNSGNSPLHYALSYSQGGGVIVDMLLSRGADTTARNSLGLLPYDGISVNDAFKHSQKVLFDKLRLVDAAFRAADEGKLLGIEQFLEYRFSLSDLVDADGRTLLSRLCRGALNIMDEDDAIVRIVKKLIECGTDVNACDRFGNSALHYALAAVPGRNLGTYLIEAGADDLIENNFDQTAYDGIGEARLAEKMDSTAVVVSTKTDDDGDDDESAVALVSTTTSTPAE